MKLHYIINSKDCVIVVGINDIVLLTTKGGNYTSIYTSDDRELITCKRLKVVFNELGCNDFIRISQSNVVNIKFIKEINKRRKYVILRTGQNIPYTVKLAEIIEKMKKV